MCSSDLYDHRLRLAVSWGCGGSVDIEPMAVIRSGQVSDVVGSTERAARRECVDQRHRRAGRKRAQRRDENETDYENSGIWQSHTSGYQ